MKMHFSKSKRIKKKYRFKFVFKTAYRDTTRLRGEESQMRSGWK
jgi:hypothetical protein